MAIFEVVFPTNKGSEISVRAECETWFDAFNSALTQVGTKSSMSSIICDVKSNNTIHVTDTESGNKYLVRELTDKKAVLETQEIGREISKPNREELLANLFEEVLEGFEKPEQQGIDFFLDLALRYIPAESGSVATSSLSSDDLHFVATRGPKAVDVKGIKITMGQGIAGFSALKNTQIAVCDVKNDPRFYAAISQKIGYKTDSIICSPLTAEGKTFGVIELINKKGSTCFDENDVAILKFIGDKLAEYINFIWDNTNNDLENL